MPKQKAQLHRLTRISALLKENRYPNSETLQKEFRRIAVEEEINIECSKKTILRDMKILKDEFKCPLDFDREHNGYYLKHHGWDFIAPALLDENEMLATVIGARIAENILPAPLKNKIRNAVDYLLQNNNPDFLDTTNMHSLTILSGLYVQIDPIIFMTMFEAWQQHKIVQITYKDGKGNHSTRKFEPHTLVFYYNSWYSKGICLLKNECRTFALHRIVEAKIMNGIFYPNDKIINSVTVDDFLGYAKIENVKFKIDDNIRSQIEANPLHSKQKINNDNTVYIPAVSKEALFPFILSSQGKITLLEPTYLKDELKTILSEIIKDY